MTSRAQRSAVFLDRDGVIVIPEFRDGRSFAPQRLEDYRFYPRVHDALSRLKRAGYVLVVVTNQPEVGRGMIATDVLAEMHRRLLARLPVDAVRVCCHTLDENCNCRKPKPGMLLDSASELGISLVGSFMVGDRASDVEAGRAAGCRTVFIDLGYTSEPKPENATFAVRSIEEAADVILAATPQREDLTMPRIEDLEIKIFADGADLDGIVAMTGNPLVAGFTTNPTLMRKAGVTDYEAFARKLLKVVTDRPISFEVFADDARSMIAQGREIASWGRNVNVKVPVTNTKGEFTGEVIRTLSAEGVVLNVTAVFTLDQVRAVAGALDPSTPAIVSVFAGRIADTGIDPVPHMRACKDLLASRPRAELLWASPRELLNIFQANEIGCHIITVTNDVIEKLRLVGKDLDEYSRETVQMFHRDAVASAFSIGSSETPAKVRVG